MKLARLLCFIGVHKYRIAWLVRPETITNPRAASTVICARCGRLYPA
jgi:hypothetical protein